MKVVVLMRVRIYIKVIDFKQPTNMGLMIRIGLGDYISLLRLNSTLVVCML